MDKEISFEIQKQLGVISQTGKGWAKELNLISWNGRPAKFDIRDWSPNREKMGRGIVLTVDEMKALRELLNSIDC
jgi:hypothetical protein